MIILTIASTGKAWLHKFNARKVCVDPLEYSTEARKKELLNQVSTSAEKCNLYEIGHEDERLTSAVENLIGSSLVLHISDRNAANW